ncbi:MAG: ATP-binding protein [Longimicrobiales bacterium]|nr:ATP-binding protein [Longimicrobiales bacterium]
MRIHHPLFVGFLGVIGLLVVLVVAFVGTGLRREVIGLTRDEVTRQVDLVRLIAESASPGTDPDSLVDALGERIGHRITLIARDGRLLGDSQLDSAGLLQAENHLDRPEIVAAFGGGTGSAERLSATVGEPFLYVAAPIEWAATGSAVIRVAAPLDAIAATLERSRRAVALAGLAAMALALVVAYALSRLLARPLVTLADRAARLARGEFSRRVPGGTRVRELEELALAFNRLTEELQARLEELGRERDEMQALIDCMAEGVVALTDDARILRTNRAARALLKIAEPPPFASVGSIIRHPELRELLEGSVREPLRARDLTIGDAHFIVSGRLLDQGGAVTTFLDVTEIRRLEKVRTDFVANASHELKTPLTSMRGFAETLLEDDPPEDLRREFLTLIRSNTLRLQALVDDLLDLSRLESGGWVARRERVELAEQAVMAWDDLDEGVRPRRELDFEIEGEGVVMADPQGVQQIFQNLIDNARRFTPDGGRVAVRIRAAPESMWTVEVSDTGTGIPSAALPRIFERFYRADTSRAREVGGTGLGLAIVRHLVHQMGGEVSAESRLGRGTTIRFTLPAAEAAAPH